MIPNRPRHSPARRTAVTSALAAGSLAALGAGPARAQAYPARPITMIVPVQAGSGADAILRIVAQRMADNLRQPIVLENLPGAAGILGAERAARAPADGYTIFGSNDGTLYMTPHLRKKVNYDPVDGFEPVSLIANITWVLIANPSLPYVGFLLLVCAVVPAGEPFAVRFGAEARPKPAFAVPTMLREGVWLLLAAGYTVSGLHKLTSPSWLDGSALGHVLDLPLARTGGVAEVLRSAPDGPLMAATWAVLALEIAALPLAFSRRTRRPVFFALVAMHLGILVTVDFADLTAGMLVAHVFAWDAVAGPLAASVADGETRPGGRAPAQGVHEAAPAVAQANGVSAVVQ